MNLSAKFTKKIIVITLISTLISFSFIGKAFAAVSSSTLISLANSSRAADGLGTLTSNGQLTAAANAKANDMLEKDYFSHTSPDGRTPWDFISAAGYNYIYAGENLAIGYTDSSELHNAWMNSPSHRENILNPNFREIGIAVVSGEYEGAQTTVVVQMFGSQTSEQNLADESGPTDNSSSESEIENSQEFNLDLNNTGFSPAKIFSGDNVKFKATVSGKIQEIYFTAGDEKIDMKDLFDSNKEDIQTLEKKEKIIKSGSFPVTIVATDSRGNKQSKELGKLEVVDKVIAKADSQINTGGLKGSIRDHWIIYSAALFLLVSAIVYIIVLRKIKFSHKLTHSLATWEF